MAKARLRRPPTALPRVKVGPVTATLSALLWLIGATQSAANGPSAPAPDLEVVGRLTNLGYEPVDDPNDMLGHGWITARLRISRVLRGRLVSRSITVRYLAHTDRAESVPVRLRLRAGKDGGYFVCAARGEDGLICH